MCDKYVYWLGMCYELQEDGFYDRVKRGRPKCSGPYGEKTIPMQIPVSMIPKITELLKARMQEVSKTRPTALDPFFTTPDLDLNKLR